MTRLVVTVPVPLHRTHAREELVGDSTQARQLTLTDPPRGARGRVIDRLRQRSGAMPEPDRRR